MSCASLSGLSTNTNPPVVLEVKYWDVYTDINGMSDQQQKFIEGFSISSIVERGGEMWMSPGIKRQTNILFLTLIPGQDSIWHINP